MMKNRLVTAVAVMVAALLVACGGPPPMGPDEGVPSADQAINGSLGASAAQQVQTRCPFQLRVRTPLYYRWYQVISRWDPKLFEEDTQHAWSPDVIETGFPVEVIAYLNGQPADGLTINGQGRGYSVRVNAPGTYALVATGGPCQANGNIEFHVDDSGGPGGGLVHH